MTVHFQRSRRPDSAVYASCFDLDDIYILGPVQKIAPDAFEYNRHVTIHVLPGSDAEHFCRNNGLRWAHMDSDFVTQNDALAEYCGEAEHVVVPTGFTEILGFAFKEKNLSKIVIPEGVEVIGDYCFKGCKQLEQVVFPTSLRFVLSDVFSDCEKLLSVALPEGVEVVAPSTFSNCKSLKTVSIPMSVREIRFHAFYRCSALKEVLIPASVKSISSRAFEGCTNLESIVIPSSVTKIGKGAFESVNNLTVHTPAGSFAESYCHDEQIACDNIIEPNQEEFLVSPVQKTSSEKTTSKPTDFTIADGVLTAYNGDADIIVIPDGVKVVGEKAFFEKRIKSVKLPGGVETIEEFAFQECRELEEVSLPRSLSSISEGSFAGCWKLKSIRFPERLRSIGQYAFYDCISLKKVVIPESVTSICKGGADEILDQL